MSVTEYIQATSSGAVNFQLVTSMTSEMRRVCQTGEPACRQTFVNAMVIVKSAIACASAV
jgi:hypothetical protein